MKTPGIYYGAIAAFCVIGFLVGFAGAADAAVPVKNGAGVDDFRHGQPPSIETMIDHLEQQGVDVTEVKTALQNGDDETVKTWLDAYRKAHKDEIPARADLPGPEKFIERLEQQGVDVTEVRTALQNGGDEAVKTWLDAYREAHKDEMPVRADLPGPEKFIERLEQQGVDVTEVKTALQNGDDEAVKTWLDAYREEHGYQMRPANRMGNFTAGIDQHL